MIDLATADQSGDFTYGSTGTAIFITGYTGAGGAVTIPATIVGLPVTTIASGVFYQKTSLTSVSIPASVASIGGLAFSNCAGLTAITVDVANAAYSSANGVLFNKAQTTLVQYPGGKAGTYAIPSSVTVIGPNAFEICAGLTQLSIPASVTDVGLNTFWGCSGLVDFKVAAANATYSDPSGVLFDKNQTTLIRYPRGKTGSYNIPSGLASIANSAFSECTGLVSVNIPAGITYIGINAFMNCSALKGVTIPTGVTSIAAGAFNGCNGLASVTIPSSVTSIEAYAFGGCEGLTKVSIPSSVTNIGNSAFYGCTHLTGVTIPSGVSSIGLGAFQSCSGLTSISVNDTNATYSSLNGVLFDKTQTTFIQYPGGKSGAYTIPSSVTLIADSAFYDCTGLTSVTIPSSVSGIGENSFRGCAGLTSITIPSSVSGIANGAFSYCSGLANMTFSGNAPTMGNSVFYGIPNSFVVRYYAARSGFTSPSWQGYLVTSLAGGPPPEVTTGAEMFLGTVNPGGLTTAAYFEYGATTAYGSTLSVSLSPDNGTTVQTVDDYLDSPPAGTTYHYRLTATNSSGTSVGEDRTWVTERTMGDYTYVTSDNTAILTNYTGSGGTVSIPATINGLPVTIIEGGTFYQITGVTSVSIPSSVTSIRGYAFYGCTGLTSVTIPSSVASIGDRAFNGCKGLNNVTIPSSVTSIGESSFAGCAGLTSINIPSSVNSIGYSAFADCPLLTAITVNNGNSSYISVNGVLFNKLQTTLIQYPAGKTGSYSIPLTVTTIDNSAFSSCQGLTSVTIPSTVTNLGDYAFSGCKGLSSVTLPTSVANFGFLAFSDCTGLTSVIIPSGVTGIGQSAFFGCTGLTNVAIPSTVTYIGGSAFSDCTGLTSVTLPSGLANIGNDTFRGCKALTNAIIPATVSSIGTTAFYGCTGLTNVTLPAALVTLESNAFSGCTGLTGVTIPANVQTIRYDPFSLCKNLTAITVDAANATFMSIGGVVFNKAQTTLILYPDGKTGPYIVPDNVTKIEVFGFSNCKGLTSLNLPASFNSIRDYIFDGCTALTTITVNAANTTFSSLDGVLFNKSQSTLVLYPGGKAGAYTIPYGVTGIERHAFLGCTGVSSVTIPSSFTSIGQDTFSSCPGLTSVIIPASVTSIVGSAFYNCSHLSSAVFSGNAPTMGSYVFNGAAANFTVYFPTGSSGFTTPTWSGYPSSMLAPEIAVEQPAGTNLTDGGTGVNFGSVILGTDASRTFTLKNTGSANLTGLAITRDGANAADFTVTANPASSVTGPSGSTTFTVRFVPGATGTRTATIHIGSNDADENPFDIALTGAGIIEPEIVVRHPAGTGLKDGVSSISFGSVAAKSSVSKTFTIKNAGKAKLTKLAVTKSGPNAKNFTVAAPLKTSLAPGASTTFKVTFKPTAIGTRKAAIHIASNDSDENPFDIALTGKGVVKAAAPGAADVARLPSWIAGGADLQLKSRLDPDVRQTTGTVRLADGRKYLTLSIVKSPWDFPIGRTVEVSPNLIDWYSGKTHTTTMTDNATLLKVRDSQPLAPGTKRYIRLKQARE